MPLYVLLIRHDPYAAVQMFTSGASGANEQRAAITAYGGTVRAQYALSGRFDELLMVEVANEITLKAIVMAGAAHGQVIEDMRAYSPDEIEQVRKIGERVAAELGEPASE
jgi:uncharacterized protein with GYD domain